MVGLGPSLIRIPIEIESGFPGQAAGWSFFVKPRPIEERVTEVGLFIVTWKDGLTRRQYDTEMEVPSLSPMGTLNPGSGETGVL